MKPEWGIRFSFLSFIVKGQLAFCGIFVCCHRRRNRGAGGGVVPPNKTLGGGQVPKNTFMDIFDFTCDIGARFFLRPLLPRHREDWKEVFSDNCSNCSIASARQIYNRKMTIWEENFEMG